MNIYPKCELCGEIPDKGLYDGFRLNGKFICSNCENSIITTDLTDEKYVYNMQKIRFILYPETLTSNYPVYVKK